MEEEMDEIQGVLFRKSEIGELSGLMGGPGWPQFVRILEHWKVLHIGATVGTSRDYSEESVVKYRQAQGAVDVLDAVMGLPEEIEGALQQKPLDTLSQP